MTSILSPNEALGLKGAALDSRVRRAGTHITDLAYRQIAQRLRDDALANELTYERDGAFEPIPVMMRPLLVMNEQVSYVNYVCEQLTDALKRLPSLYLSDPAVKRILAITPGEDEWLRTMWTDKHQRNNTVYGRLDAVCDFTAAGWQDTLHFMEANLSGVGGINYAPLAEQLVMRDIVPALLEHDPGLSIELPRDQRGLFIQVLIDHARAIGRGQCRLSFVEPKYAEDGINEQSVLSQFLAERHGLVITHADPTELWIKDGDVFHGDTCIDVVYRDYEVRDLIELEEELGKPLDGMRQLFRENRVVSSLVGDFDHKSCWEVLTDPAIAEKYFSAEECRLFRRHVLWTRVVRERRTTLPHSAEGDLVEFIRTHREELVLKPNRSYGGEGVTIGAATSAADWEARIGEALEGEDDPDLSWVVQRATRLPVAEFPIVSAEGRVFHEPFYAVMGFAPTENGLGTMCRVSQKQVVNVAQHGGMAAVLTAYAPEELRVPKRATARGDGAEKALRAKIGDLINLDNAIAVLEWDEETSLPHGGAEERGAQLATLEAMRHALLTSDMVGDLIEDVAAARGDDPRWQRELDILRDLREGEIAMPVDLVRAFAEARAVSSAAWEEARGAEDFSILAPALAETIKLARESALAADPDGDPYDTLLDEYEPGQTRARLDPLFATLRDRLTPLVSTLADKTASWPDHRSAAFDISEAASTALARTLLGAIGFDFERGQVGRAVHPGTSAVGFDDVRLALREGSGFALDTLLTTLHEGGHGLYDQGHHPGDRGTLLAQAPSMALHESQARLWENHIGRSRAFWSFFLPHLRDGLGGLPAGFDAEALFRATSRVRPSLIRASADELTYPLHILLRTELEQALIAGDLAVGDLPDTWTERSKSLIGVAPDSARTGVLQDGHWAAGMFGYFPTYTIGSLYAAQLVSAFERTRPLAADVARGDFAPLLQWLRTHIHHVGDRKSADDIIRDATGRGLDAQAYFDAIAAKYA